MLESCADRCPKPGGTGWFWQALLIGVQFAFGGLLSGCRAAPRQVAHLLEQQPAAKAEIGLAAQRRDEAGLAVALTEPPAGEFPQQNQQPGPELFMVQPSDAQRSRAYVLGVGDVVEVSVWDEPGLGIKCVVGEEGSVLLPLVGPVRAAGCTPSELEEAVAQEYDDGYLVAPHVSITVVARSSRKVYVLGAVRSPGVYPLEGATTLIELLAKCGGAAQNASDSVVLVRRGPQEPIEERPDVVGNPTGEEDEEEQGRATNSRSVSNLKISLSRLLSGDFTSNVLLADGDIILFPSSRQTTEQVYVLGDIEKRGAYPLQDGMTLMKLVASLGLNPEDEKSTVTIFRFSSGEMQREILGVKEILQGETGSDFSLQDGDMLNIERPLETYYVIGQVAAGGTFRCQEGLTVREAIVRAGWVTPRGNLNKINVMRKIGTEWITEPVQLKDEVLPGDVIKVEERWF